MAEPASPLNRFEQRRLQNRAALLDAAIELFQRQGLRATKLEEICARADVSSRTFFNHFETREHLYRAIAAQRSDQMASLLDATSQAAGSFADRLIALLDEMSAYLAERPAYRELVSEMLSLRPAPGSEAGRRSELVSAVRRFVESGVARGEVARRHPPEVLADLLFGALTVALTNWCADEDYDLQAGLGQSARALLELFS